MNFEFVLKPSAEKQLLRLPKALQRRLMQKLGQIQSNPWMAGSTKLAGADATWRVRVGDYRIVYEIQEGDPIVFVTIIAHRREVYRGL